MTASDGADPVRLELRGAELLVLVTGDLDAEVAHRPVDLVHAHLAEASAPDATSTPTVVVVDLTATSFVDSTGIGGLLRVQQEVSDHGLPFVLRGVGPRLYRLLQITGLDQQFDLD